MSISFVLHKSHRGDSVAVQGHIGGFGHVIWKWNTFQSNSREIGRKFNEKWFEEISLISDWSGPSVDTFCPYFTIYRLGLVLLAAILSIFSALHFRGVEHKEKTSIKRFIPPLLLWDARSRAPLPRPTPHAYATQNVNQIKKILSNRTPFTQVKSGM
jgi:hypothetical protein